ncbi:MAG: TIGR04282 family arsenosugar biosynthesis glycosyltransferase [Bacteroidota bacterium]
MQQTLLIFIKNPELGKAKTRIAQAVGDEKALQIYLELLAHTRKVAKAVNANRHLYYSRFIDESDEWTRQDFQKFLQSKGTLGTRMAQAFQTAFQTSEKVLIIGSDCASLSTEIVTKAFDALDRHDFVLGPATDGGYYLLGMKKFQPSVFEAIAWSTAQVFPTTIQRIEALEQSYFLLPELSDIDHWEDWLKYGWKISFALSFSASLASLA